MKNFILGILLTAAFVFAQDVSEQTAEGYRIIRIDTAATTAYKDSVKQAEDAKRIPVPLKFSMGITGTIGKRLVDGEPSPSEYYIHDSYLNMFYGTAYQIGLSVLIPLNEYNYAIRTGLYYGYASLDGEDIIATKIDSVKYYNHYGCLTQKRLIVPLLFALKPKFDMALFEIGTQVSFPIFDEFELYQKKVDMIDEGYRSSVDVALVFGLEIYVTKKFSLLGYMDMQLNDAYKGDIFPGMDDISHFEIKIGAGYALF